LSAAIRESAWAAPGVLTAPAGAGRLPVSNFS
jgi:hypothetical protein